MGKSCFAVLCMMAGLSGPAQAQDQIVIQDEDTRFVQDRPTARDTTLQMQAVTVQDQNQLRGRFGDAWAAEEVRERAAQVCGEAGMRLVYFQPGATDTRGRTEFAAVCQ